MKNVALKLVFDNFLSKMGEINHIKFPSDRVDKFLRILINDFHFTDFLLYTNEGRKAVLKNADSGDIVSIEFEKNIPFETYSNYFPQMVTLTGKVYPGFKDSFPSIRFNPNRSEAPYPGENELWERLKPYNGFIFRHDKKTISQIMITEEPIFKTSFSLELFKTQVEEKKDSKNISIGLFHLRELALHLKYLETHLNFFHQKYFQSIYKKSSIAIESLQKSIKWLESEYSSQGYHSLISNTLLLKNELIPPGWLLEIERSVENVEETVQLIQEELKKNSNALWNKQLVWSQSSPSYFKSMSGLWKDVTYLNDYFFIRLEDIQKQKNLIMSKVKWLTSQTYGELIKPIGLSNKNEITLDGPNHQCLAFFHEKDVLVFNGQVHYLFFILDILKKINATEVSTVFEILGWDLLPA